MKRKLAVCLLGLFCATQSVVFAGHKVEEKIVGPGMGPNVSYTISPKGLHLGTVSMKGSRFVATVDGVEGPQFDEIYNCAPIYTVQYTPQGYVSGEIVTATNAFAFSPDGTRYAYAGRLGKELVVIADGKELFRGELTNPTLPAVAGLQFSPDGKRVYFYKPTTDTMQSYVIVMDGKPQIPSNGAPFVYFSPDGSRYAYIIAQPLQGQEPCVVVDGQKVNYLGDRIQFTPDNKSVVCVSQNPDTNQQSLLVDGKPLMTERFIDSFQISSTNNIGAIVSNEDGRFKRLAINGKVVAGTDNAWSVKFSPDGKRWAVKCADGGQTWMVIDGKPGAQYTGINDSYFTTDSSKFLYVAQVQNKSFVVIEDQEFEGGNYMRVPLKVSSTGGNYGYVAGDSTGDMKAVVNGMAYAPKTDVRLLQLSPDGSRFGFTAQIDAFGAKLFIDGQEQSASTGDMASILFSNDSKHYLAWARPPQGPPAIYIDGKYFGTGGNRPLQFSFSDDSKHVSWMISEDNEKREGVRHFYVDGEKVAEFHRFEQGFPRDLKWESNADGTITVLGSSLNSGQNAPGPVKRVTITPDPDLTVDKMIANYEAAQQKAAEDAAKKKQEEAAAAQKAKEDSLKAQQEAAAKKQAAADAAAAKKKAREDALAAKKKAQEEAAAKKKAAAQQP